MGSLLDKLGLQAPPPAGAASAPKASSIPTSLKMRDDGSAAKKPYDLSLAGLDLPKNYNPDSPKKPIDLKMPADPQKQVELLADAIAKTQDAAKGDQLVRALRDALAKIQPVMSNAEAKKEIDKLIDKGIDAAAKALLMKLIETAVGKPGTQMPDDDHRTQYGPAVKEKDLGEHILKTPEIPFGKPPAVHRNSFEFRGLPKTAKPSAYVDFKLLTPDWFDPNKSPGSWVIVMEADDFKKNQQSAHNLHDVHIIGKGTLSLTLAMPDDPGKYVIAIKIGPGFESYPVEDIELKK